MNTRERFVRVLTGQPVDRVPFIKVFGGTNACRPEWERECPGLATRIDQLLRFEGRYRGWDVAPVNLDLSRVPPARVLREDAEQVVRRRGDGAIEVINRRGDFHAQVVEWPVKSRRDWERVKAEHLQADDPSRFPADWAAHVERYRGRDWPLQLTHRGVYGLARNLLGDEALAYAFYDDPALVHEIMDTYTEMALAVWSRMVAGVEYDLVECWEDMAYRSGSLISPALFREFLTPNYRRIAEFARAHRIPIILVDSDGYIEDLTELMLEAGVTALYPYEVQSGNDVPRVRRRFPTAGVIGGLDKNAMARGRAAIDAELERARGLIRLGRFIPGPDHFVLSDVSWDGYRYFMEGLREVVATTVVGDLAP